MQTKTTLNIAMIFLTLGVAHSASAALIQGVGRSSTISISSLLAFPYNYYEGKWQSGGLGEFNESVAFSNGLITSASQHSTITADAIHYQDALFYQQTDDWTSDAKSTFSVTFDITETSIFNMDWALSFEHGPQRMPGIMQSIRITKEGDSDRAFFIGSDFGTKPPYFGPGGTLTSCSSEEECYYPANLSAEADTLWGYITAGRYTLTISNSIKRDAAETQPALASSIQFNLSVTPVPVPAAAWLMGSGLIGLAGVARKRKRQ